MTTLNIEALQKTQQSIADQSIPFNMLSWLDCIYAHAGRANAWSLDIEETAQRLGTTASLFRPAHDTDPFDRSAAIARIQALIDAAAPPPALQPEEEPELVGTM